MRHSLFARILIAAACAGLVSQSNAADMPVKAPVVKAPIVVPWTWTGFYVGGNAGYSWGRWNSTSVGPIFPGFTADPRVDGIVAGGQVGYNWQFDHWVLGLETDIQWTGERARSSGTTITVTPLIPGAGLARTETLTAVQNEWSFPWFGTFRARVGATTADHWLFYVTGGLAYGDVRFSNVSTVTATTFSPLGLLLTQTTVTTGMSGSTTKVGWTIGGGIEKAFDRNWSIKGEYLYVDLGTHTFSGGTAFATSVRVRDHIARIGLNYRFDPGPVVARY